MSSEIIEEEKNDLNFTQKCILYANITRIKDKIILNPFDFIPKVKIYTSSIRQQIFTYTKIKGALFIIKNKNKKDAQKFLIRVYSYKDYSLQFNLEINSEVRKNYVEIEPNFYCFCLRVGFIGFKFNSKEEAKRFYDLLENEPNKQILDEFGLIEKLTIKDTDSIYLNIIDHITSSLDESFQKITGEYVKYELSKVDEYLQFANFLHLSKLLTNSKFDYEDNVFDIYVDKKYPYKLFKIMFRHFDLHRLYPLRPVINDCLFISNKDNYINILVEHVNNNFKQQVVIYRKRKGTKAKEKPKNQIKEDTTINSSKEPTKSFHDKSINNNKNENAGDAGGDLNSKKTIESDNKEEEKNEGGEPNEGSVLRGLNRFFCGLNIFN
jgi:hypothetical protein